MKKTKKNRFDNRLYRNCCGICNVSGPRTGLHAGYKLGLGPTIEQTTEIPGEPIYYSLSSSFMKSVGIFNPAVN